MNIQKINEKKLAQQLITEMYDNKPVTALGVPEDGTSVLNMYDRGQWDINDIKYLHAKVMEAKKK